MYNRLYTSIAPHDTVTEFQQSLQQLLKSHVMFTCEYLKITFSPHVHAYAQPLR